MRIFSNSSYVTLINNYSSPFLTITSSFFGLPRRRIILQRYYHFEYCVQRRSYPTRKQRFIINSPHLLKHLLASASSCHHHPLEGPQSRPTTALASLRSTTFSSSLHAVQLLARISISSRSINLTRLLGCVSAIFSMAAK